DPSLAAPLRVAPPHQERPEQVPSERRPVPARLFLIAGVIVVAAVVTAVAVRLSQESRALTALANSVAVIDTRHDAVSATIQVGGQPGGIAYGAGAVWVTDTADDLLLRIDPARRTVDRIPVSHGPAGVT